MFNSNNAIHSLPIVQIALGIVLLFKKIYHGEPILTVFSVKGEDVLYKLYNIVVSVICIVLFENCDAAHSLSQCPDL